jgi:hypothetical protein
MYHEKAQEEEGPQESVRKPRRKNFGEQAMAPPQDPKEEAAQVARFFRRARMAQKIASVYPVKKSTISSMVAITTPYPHVLSVRRRHTPCACTAAPSAPREPAGRWRTSVCAAPTR